MQRMDPVYTPQKLDKVLLIWLKTHKQMIESHDVKKTNLLEKLRTMVDGQKLYNMIAPNLRKLRMVTTSPQRHHKDAKSGFDGIAIVSVGHRYIWAGLWCIILLMKTSTVHDIMFVKGIVKWVISE